MIFGMTDTYRESSLLKENLQKQRLHNQVLFFSLHALQQFSQSRWQQRSKNKVIIMFRKIIF